MIPVLYIFRPFFVHRVSTYTAPLSVPMGSVHAHDTSEAFALAGCVVPLNERKCKERLDENRKTKRSFFLRPEWLVVERVGRAQVQQLVFPRKSWLGRCFRTVGKTI